MTSAERAFQTFHHGHHDLVLAVDFNFYGDRMVTASSDQKLKVWDRKGGHDGEWVSCDIWKAHEAEIVDVKFSNPFTNPHVASIGEDGLFKLWREDPLSPTNSGRRWRLAAMLKSETKVPFQALDFKFLMVETYLALITRDGYLTVSEPQDHDTLQDWQHIHREHVCPTPSRQEETGLRVSWHKEKLPCWTAVQAGVPRTALCLAVAAMNVVKILRTDRDRKFYCAAEIKGPEAIIRDVSWASGSMRGYDLVATACKDGHIRIYEITTPGPAKTSAVVDNSASKEKEKGRGNAMSVVSGIGAGLAVGREKDSTVAKREDRVRHLVRKVADLERHHGGVWRLQWSAIGDLLVSTGDDGAIRTWKKAVNGQWLEAAELQVTRE